MKEFLELKKALNCGLIVTPDKGTKNEKAAILPPDANNSAMLSSRSWNRMNRRIICIYLR